MSGSRDITKLSQTHGSYRSGAVILVSLMACGCVTKSKFQDLEGRHQKLQKQYEELDDKNKSNEQKSAEQARWIRELETRIGDSKTDKARLETSLAETKKALEDSARRKAEADKRLAEFSDLVRKFKTLMDAGRLSVKIIDGRMVVGLSSDILFASGSSRLSNEGRAAIREVGQLLATIPNRQFQVEGHTDNVRIQTSQFPSNWELASARAVNVVKEMVDAGLPPNRVSAASYGEFKPARPNETKEGRAVNRRIEIVIVPDLSSLPGFEELRRYSDVSER